MMRQQASNDPNNGPEANFKPQLIVAATKPQTTLRIDCTTRDFADVRDDYLNASILHKVY
jgi:hypothetical protein